MPRHVGLLAGFSSLRPEEQKAPTTLEDGLAQYTSLVQPSEMSIVIGESSASLAFHRTRVSGYFKVHPKERRQRRE